ncbi:MAG: substrate-binding domain-containing protein [Jatrophihabitans endophyticus]|nr:substrate-binding domain-containing protein [Jatrophihabitans endophyticus]
MLSACDGPGGSRVKVALILKEFTNPYWISMEDAAKAEAAKNDMYLQVSAGMTDDDTYSQIQEVDEAIAEGVKGIIITPNGDAVNRALDQAKTYGITVVVLDTAPMPASTADVTYATNNEEAGGLIGKWLATKLDGKSADIALLDDLGDQVLSVDVDRDHGFLKGMGIPVGNPNMNGGEPKSGKYTGGKGGSYKISCQLPTEGAETGGQSAMETCLSKDSNINAVYAINEPSAEGATKALKAAGKKNVTVVAVDGGCAALPFVRSGAIGATAGQYPDKMARLGVDAVAKFARTGRRPKNQAGQDFYNTGTKLYTDDPQHGVASLTTSKASKICWGSTS